MKGGIYLMKGGIYLMKVGVYLMEGGIYFSQVFSVGCFRFSADFYLPTFYLPTVRYGLMSVGQFS